MKVNECRSVLPPECTTKRSLYDQVMRATNISLNTDVSPAVKERWARWTTYANLLAWFKNFRKILIEFDFAGVDSNGELDINEEQMRQIVNVNEMEIAINGSQTRVGSGPVVSFQHSQLPLTSRAVAKSSLACTGIFGSNATGECIPLHWQLPTSATAKERGML
jgi:hypothetical protein